jgi:predicted MFS family arabinose efflux permease
MAIVYGYVSKGELILYASSKLTESSYLYLLFTTLTSVFRNTYGFSSSNVGLVYLGIGVGMFSGIFIFGKFSDPLIQKLAARNNGVLEPEYRIPPMIPAAAIIPAGLFLYGWTAQYEVHWIVPIIGTGLVGFGLITTFVSMCPTLTRVWLTPPRRCQL